MRLLFFSAARAAPLPMLPDRTQSEIEGRPPPRFRLHPDQAAVPFDDLLADCEPDARACIFGSSVQPLKQHENAVEVLGIDADAVVGDTELPQVGIALGRD